MGGRLKRCTPLGLEWAAHAPLPVSEKSSGAASALRESGPLEPNQERDLLVGGEAVELQFRKYLGAIDTDLEGTTLALDQFGLDIGEGLTQFGGQTGRLGRVVSHRAVLDRDFHG